MTNEAQELVRQDCDRVIADGGELLGDIGDANILVTGGTGFMGSWIAEMVLRLNASKKTSAKVYLMGRDYDRFERNLGHHAGNPAVEFIRCDIRNIMDIPKDVHYVIHAAGTPDNRVHVSNPVETMVSIAEGTHAVLRAADRVSNLRMFLNISSSSVYGVQPLDMERIAEEYTGMNSPPLVSAAYASAKRYGEALVNAARSEARIPAATVRPFAFIGACQPLDAPWAVNNFIMDAINKRPIRILGDGKTVRSVMYGADLALWLLTIMSRVRSGQVFNVGSDDALTVEHLAGKIAAKFLPVPPIILNSALTGTIPNTRQVPDTTAARSQFGLRLFTSTDLALERSVHWHRLQTGER